MCFLQVCVVSSYNIHTLFNYHSKFLWYLDLKCVKNKILVLWIRISYTSKFLLISSCIDTANAINLNKPRYKQFILHFRFFCAVCVIYVFKRRLQTVCICVTSFYFLFYLLSLIRNYFISIFGLCVTSENFIIHF